MLEALEVEQGWSTSLEAPKTKCDKKVGKEEVANTGGKGVSLWRHLKPS